MSRTAVVLFALLHAFVVAGCSPRVMPAPRSPAIDAGPLLRAGIARTDITPPPGLSLFGHGPEGRVAVGTLLRLYCEAFVFTKGHAAVALVPCDIGAPSQELHREVADRVVKSGVPLGADRILLMGTHTHAGPAHYFGAKQYSATFSSRVPGFDPEVLGFLADRIATAVRLAYASRVRARLSWRIDAMGGDGLVKNRSFEAFTLNRGLPECLKKRVSQESITEGQISAAVAATDTTLSVLRIDRVLEGGPGAPATTPMGAFVVFGIHNTAIPNTNDVYHSDVFGFALRGAEALLAKKFEGRPDAGAEGAASAPPPAPIVVGIANGIEGDVSPMVGYRGIGEARRLGEELGRRIVRAFERDTPDSSDPCKFFEVVEGEEDLARVYRELYVPNAIADYVQPGGRGQAPLPVRLCAAPEIGSAAAGGAEDGPTRFRVFPEMNEGARASIPRSCQGRKLPIREPPGVGFTDDGIDFPNTAPIALVRLGGVTIAAAPFEMTTVVGLRIRAALERELKTPRRVVVVGLTNSYLQYVTTAEEYAQQNYEGASTLYGPWTADFLENHFVCLAQSLSAGASRDAACRMGQERELNTVYEMTYRPVVVSRMPDPGEDEDEDIELPDPAVKEALQDLWPAWIVRFRGPPPGDTTLRLQQRVRIVDAASGEVLDDDSGTSIETRYDLTAADRRTWMVRWVPRLGTRSPLCSRTVRFALESARRLVSAPFKVTCPAHLTERSSGDTEDEQLPRRPEEAPR
ncbi:neutral/alkaline non-lysosomal ceramidase N-terminal domain-containing protein [Sorangium sp. So ce429]